MDRLLVTAAAMILYVAPAAAAELPKKTDPVFVEAYQACLDAASGLLPFNGRGWISQDGDVDAHAWENWTGAFASKDFEGVGGMNLSTTVELYPDYTVSYCVVVMEEPRREIAAPALKSAADWVGTLQGDAADWSGVWRNTEASVFVRGGMSSQAQRFRLSVTQIHTVSVKDRAMFLP